MTDEQAAGEDTGNAEPQHRYFIDLDWYREQERSFVTLAASRLCASAHDKKTLKSEATLLNTLKQCCSKQPSFTTPNMPLLELVFRIFLTNGNQPLTLDQLRDKMYQPQAHGASLRDLSVSSLQRIVDNDTYYGLRPTR
jgi:hypothetical protein